MSLLQAIMNREGCSKSEAKEIIAEMREAFNEVADPEDVLFEYGLEPDYVFDLIE